MERRMTGNKGAINGCAGCFYHRTDPMAVSFAAPQMFYRVGALKQTALDFPQDFYKQDRVGYS